MLRFATVLVLLTSGAAPDAGPVICQPGATRCGNLHMKSQTAERCNAAGTQWVVEVTCVTLCNDGSCSFAAPSNY